MKTIRTYDNCRECNLSDETYVVVNNKGESINPHSRPYIGKHVKLIADKGKPLGDHFSPDYLTVHLVDREVATFIGIQKENLVLVK